MWVFKETKDQKCIEGRFWSTVAVVAVVSCGIDWAAYIGAGGPIDHTELDTCQSVADSGNKLSENDARYFFPDFENLIYRS